MSKYFILTTVADNGKASSSGPYRSVSACRTAIRQVMDKEAIAEDILQDDLDSDHPYVVFCNQSGLPITMAVLNDEIFVEATLENGYMIIAP